MGICGWLWQAAKTQNYCGPTDSCENTNAFSLYSRQRHAIRRGSKGEKKIMIHWALTLLFTDYMNDKTDIKNVFHLCSRVVWRATEKNKTSNTSGYMGCRRSNINSNLMWLPFMVCRMDRGTHMVHAHGDSFRFWWLYLCVWGNKLPICDLQSIVFLYQKQCIGKVLLLFFVKIRKLWYIVRGVKTVTASDCHFSTIFHSV